MQTTTLEHVNVTVSDPQKTATMMCDLFDWKIRWQGPSMQGGNTIHVGTDDTYLAVYAMNDHPKKSTPTYITQGGLNHIGIVVDDLEAIEERVVTAGFKTTNHGDYEPGRRFYFDDHDGIEFEIISYTPKKG